MAKWNWPIKSSFGRMEYDRYTHNYTTRQNYDVVVTKEKADLLLSYTLPIFILKPGRETYKISFYKYFSFLGGPWVMTTFHLVKVLN